MDKVRWSLVIDKVSNEVVDYHFDAEPLRKRLKPKDHFLYDGVELTVHPNLGDFYDGVEYKIAPEKKPLLYAFDQLERDPSGHVDYVLDTSTLEPSFQLIVRPEGVRKIKGKIRLAPSFPANWMTPSSEVAADGAFYFLLTPPSRTVGFIQINLLPEDKSVLPTLVRILLIAT